MKHIRYPVRLASLFCFAFVVTATAQQQPASLTGAVREAQTGQPLASATVTLTGTTIGEVTDLEGRYHIPGIEPGDYVVTISFMGFRDETVPVTLAPGDEHELDVVLEEEVIEQEEVVILGGLPQRVSDIPAGVSILSGKEIEQGATTSPTEKLRQVPGVDMVEVGIDRREIVVRGFNNAFSGAAYVLTDHRQSAVPSLAVNAFSMMPIMEIDLARIEVVRGPGSARFGPGVDEGVIHFVTKNPFDYSGTTVAISGGEQSFFSGQLRHAGVVGRRLGYKVTGHYAQAEDWALDMSDPHDREQDSLYFRDIPRQDDTYRGYVGGSLVYRFSPGTSLTANGGWATSKSIFLSRIGTLQSDGFGYAYGQLRLEAGGFTAQGYLNKNHAGDSFVYASQAASLSGASVVDESNQWKVEAQYGFDLFREREQITVGADYEQTTPITDGTITGRNEDDDVIQEVGLYAQSGTRLSEQLSLTLAARLDYDNIYETLQLSPRAGLVYKPARAQAFRASYNRAISSPSVNSQFLDIPARVVPLIPDLPGAPSLVFQARGAGEGFTFDTFRQTNAAPFLLPVPGFFGQPVDLSAVPLLPVYGAAAPGIVKFLKSPAPLPDPLPPFPDPMRTALADLIGYIAQQGAIGSDATTGAVQLGLPDDSERGYQNVTGPLDIAPLKQTITQTYEVGYKGMVGDRLVLALDGYHTRKKNFVGALSVDSPLAYLQGGALAQDVGAALGQLFATTDDPMVLGQLQQLAEMGLSPAQVTQIMAGLVGGALADTPTAVVQPDGSVLPPEATQAIGALMTYRNFGEVTYSGFDASAELLATDRLSLFGNVSWISDNYFDHEELSEESEDLSLSLNAPQFKARAGIGYEVPQGLSVRLGGRYTGGFRVESGPYEGEVDPYFVLDVGLGYDFDRTVPGLRLDLAVQNALDHDHREFIGAPQVGRLAIGRLTYTVR